MTSLKDALDQINRDDEQRAQLLGMAALRQAISCARCAQCNEQIGDQDWTVVNVLDTDELIHDDCVSDMEDDARAVR